MQRLATSLVTVVGLGVAVSGRVSARAKTIFQGTRTPLTVRFAAAWQMTSDKQGISALGLKRVLDIGSTQTAWAMLHRYRSAMVRADRDRLSGTVEADDAFLGGPEPGAPGRSAWENPGGDRCIAAGRGLWTLSDASH